MWTCVPDIDENRVPRVIYKAVKLPNSDCESDPMKECRRENKTSNVMYITPNSQGAYNFSLGVVEVPVALSCVDKPRETVENGEDVAYDDWFD
jgi:hypothetical protein